MTDTTTILTCIAALHDLTLDELRGQARRADIAHARQIAMYVLWKQGMSLNAIGAALGGRDHSTVIHGRDKIAAALDNSPTLRRLIREVLARPRLATRPLPLPQPPTRGMLFWAAQSRAQYYVEAA